MFSREHHPNPYVSNFKATLKVTEDDLINIANKENEKIVQI